MIQSVLLFALGFLTAAFVALMVAPLLRRRVEQLTRRRLEATMPLSRAQIQAEKDRLRAQFAMSTRRLEMNIKALNDKAAAQLVELNKCREELRRLEQERLAGIRAAAESDAGARALRDELERRDDRIRQLGERLAEAERALEQRSQELEKLNSAYEEASFTASNRQIELVARESDIDRLTADVQTLRDELKSERSRAVEAEKKAAELSLRLTTLLADAKGGDIEDALANLTGERDRLEARLAALTRENRQLKSRLGEADSEQADETGSDADEKLREQISDLAAQVVVLTEKLEGQESPLASLLEGDANGDRPGSLADRIRALRKPGPKRRR